MISSSNGPKVSQGERALLRLIWGNSYRFSGLGKVPLTVKQKWPAQHATCLNVCPASGALPAAHNSLSSKKPQG